MATLVQCILQALPWLSAPATIECAWQRLEAHAAAHTLRSVAAVPDPSTYPEGDNIHKLRCQWVQTCASGVYTWASHVTAQPASTCARRVCRSACGRLLVRQRPAARTPSAVLPLALPHTRRAQGGAGCAVVCDDTAQWREYAKSASVRVRQKLAQQPQVLRNRKHTPHRSPRYKSSPSMGACRWNPQAAALLRKRGRMHTRAHDASAAQLT